MYLILGSLGAWMYHKNECFLFPMFQRIVKHIVEKMRLHTLFAPLPTEFLDQNVVFFLRNTKGTFLAHVCICVLRGCGCACTCSLFLFVFLWLSFTYAKLSFFSILGSYVVFSKLISSKEVLDIKKCIQPMIVHVCTYLEKV